MKNRSKSIEVIHSEGELTEDVKKAEARLDKKTEAGKSTHCDDGYFDVGYYPDEPMESGDAPVADDWYEDPDYQYVPDY